MSFGAHNARPGVAATITPNAGLRGLYELLGSALRNRSHAPTACGVGLRFAWVNSPCTPGSVAVMIDGAHSSTPPLGYIRRNGSFDRTPRAMPEVAVALRNLAAEPGRRFRRYGQEKSLCPFCQRHLGYGTRASVIGFCAECARHLGWPHDERAAKHAEDVLRRDVVREVEDEQPEESAGGTGEAGPGD